MTRNDIFSTLAILGTGALLAGCATVNADASEARSPEASRHGESNCASGSCGGKAAKHDAPAEDETMEADAAPAAAGDATTAPAASESPAAEPAPKTKPAPKKTAKKKKKSKKHSAGEAACGEGTCA